MSEIPIADPTAAPAPRSPALSCRHLMRGLDRATLATTTANRDGTWPYASLVLVACDLSARPLLLISDLAEHTRNLARDNHASLLFDGTGGFDDALTGPRATVLGEIAPDPDPVNWARFLRRHPSAAVYAGFKDFRLYRMRVIRAHLVAGFGRIDWIEAGDLVGAPTDTAWLGTAEPDILRHMNEDHAATLDLCAQRLLGLEGQGWILTGVDPDGADLRRGGRVGRLDFSVPVDDTDNIRQAFIALAQSARRDEAPP